MSDLLERVARRASTAPGDVVCRFLDRGEAETASVSYGDLWARANVLASHLLALGQPGDRALLAYSPGVEFPVAFLACLVAGVIAVPVDVPRRRSEGSSLLAIARDCGATLFLSEEQDRDRLPPLSGGGLSGEGLSGAPFSATGWLFTNEITAALTAGPAPAPATGASTASTSTGGGVACLQYSSGTTGTPRGIILTRQALDEQLADYSRRAAPGLEKGTFVSWLPHTHDFGLIGFVLSGLYMGITHVTMPPSAFLGRPARWIRAISRYRGTYCGGPSFGYDLCVAAAEGLGTGIDLSCLTVASLGGDYVIPGVLRRFEEAYACHGFNPAAWYPAYGLAESVLCVTGRSGASVTGFDARSLRQGLAQPAGETPAGDSGIFSLVSCGSTMAGKTAQIVDPRSNQPLAENHVGEIWLQGRSLGSGYWNNPADTAEGFNATLAGGSSPYVRTGDLGFLSGGELYITGRLKDAIVLHGTNHAPEAVEITARDTSPALGWGALIQTDLSDGGRLVLVQEIRRDSDGVPPGLPLQVRAAVAAGHGLDLDEVILIRAGTLPRSRTGKVSRHAVRIACREGTLRRLGGWRREDMQNEDIMPPLQTTADAATSLSGDPVLRELRALNKGMAEQNRLLTALITLLSGQQGTPAIRPLPAGNATAIEEPSFPLTGTQQDILMLGNIQQEAASLFNLTMVLQCRHRQPPDAATTRQALRQVTARHEALRTVIEGSGQRVLPYVEPDVEEVRIQDGRALHDWLRAGRRRVIDPGRAPLWRVALVNGPDNSSLVVFTAHRLIVDGSSAPVLARDIGKALEAAGTPLPVATPFRVHARALEAAQASPGQDKRRQYWRALLDPRLPDWVPPGDRVVASITSHDAATHSLSLPPALHKALLLLASQCSATLFDTLLAIYFVLLHRVSGQQRILVGVDPSGRQEAPREDREGAGNGEDSDMVGCRDVLLPVVIDFAETGTPGAFLKKVCSRIVEALAHKDYTLSMWARDTRRPPDPDRMFMVTAAMGMSRLAGQDGGLSPRPDLDSIARDQSPFGLALEAREGKDGLRLDFVYNRELLAGATVIRLADYYLTLLQAFSRGGEGDVLALEMLSGEEIHRQTRWGASGGSLAEPSLPELSLPELSLTGRIAARCQARPDAIAVRQGIAASPAPDAPDISGTMDYQTLWATSGKIAGRIRERVAEPGAVVALCLERSPLFVAAFLAVLRSGHCILLLDPAAPPAGTASRASAAGARLFLYDSTVFSTDSSSTGPCTEQLSLDISPAALSAWAADTATACLPLPAADTPALVIAVARKGAGTGTGTETGEAASALALTTVSRGGLLDDLQSRIAALGLEATDRVAWVAPPDNISLVWQFLAPLLAGGQVDILDEGLARDGIALTSEADRRQISILRMAPSVLVPLLDHLQMPAHRPKLSRLRWLVCGGEPLAAEACRRWIALYPDVPLLNTHGFPGCFGDGAIEAVIWPPKPGQYRTPVGRPTAGTTVRLVNRACGQVPAGAPGTVLVEGSSVGTPGTSPGIGPGFGPGGKSCWHHTGETARFRPDGSLDTLGADGRWIMINGVRIEPREIEAAIENDPLVMQSLVVGQNDPDGITSLVAYAVPRPGKTLLEGGVKAVARTFLPPDLVPSRIIIVDALPLDATGQLDETALPVPAPRASAMDDTPAETGLQAELLEIWTEVLDVTGFGIHADLFDLGGGSLDATQIAGHVAQRFDASIPVSEIFRAPTVAGMAAWLAEHRLTERRTTEHQTAGQADGGEKFSGAAQ